MYTSDDRILMKEALKIHRIVISNDFNQFFKLIRGRTNFMFACLMLTRIQEMRRKAVESLTKTFAKVLPDKHLV
jgi:hypothetical protein